MSPCIPFTYVHYFHSKGWVYVIIKDIRPSVHCLFGSIYFLHFFSTYLDKTQIIYIFSMTKACVIYHSLVFSLTVTVNYLFIWEFNLFLWLLLEHCQASWGYVCEDGRPHCWWAQYWHWSWIPYESEGKMLCINVLSY